MQYEAIAQSSGIFMKTPLLDVPAATESFSALKYAEKSYSSKYSTESTKNQQKESNVLRISAEKVSYSAGLNKNVYGLLHLCFTAESAAVLLPELLI